MSTGTKSIEETLNQSLGSHPSPLASNISLNGNQSALFPVPDEKNEELATGEDEQRYWVVMWALARVDRDMTSDDQMFRLEESLAGINEMETQQTRIKEAKRLLKLCHVAGLIDALATKDDLVDAMTVTSQAVQLEKVAYRQLKAAMDQAQRNRLGTYMVMKDLGATGQRISNLNTC
jgi:hypothetical protein